MVTNKTDTRTATQRMKDLGFSNNRERHNWLVEHQGEIKEYCATNGKANTIRKFHIGGTTLSQILTGKLSGELTPSKTRKERESLLKTPLPKKEPFTAKEFAEEVLEGYAKMKCDLTALREENKNLKNRNLYLEGQLKLREEDEQKDFSKKVEKTIAHSGD